MRIAFTTDWIHRKQAPQNLPSLVDAWAAFDTALFSGPSSLLLSYCAQYSQNSTLAHVSIRLLKLSCILALRSFPTYQISEAFRQIQLPHLLSNMTFDAQPTTADLELYRRALLILIVAIHAHGHPFKRSEMAISRNYLLDELSLALKSCLYWTAEDLRRFELLINDVMLCLGRTTCSRFFRKLNKENILTQLAEPPFSADIVHTLRDSNRRLKYMAPTKMSEVLLQTWMLLTCSRMSDLTNQKTLDNLAILIRMETDEDLRNAINHMDHPRWSHVGVRFDPDKSAEDHLERLRRGQRRSELWITDGKNHEEQAALLSRVPEDWNCTTLEIFSVASLIERLKGLFES